MQVSFELYIAALHSHAMFHTAQFGWSGMMWMSIFACCPVLLSLVLGMVLCGLRSNDTE